MKGREGSIVVIEKFGGGAWGCCKQEEKGVLSWEKMYVLVSGEFNINIKIFYFNFNWNIFCYFEYLSY